jgi:hypothetical protein
MVYSSRKCRAALEKKGFVLDRRTTDDFYYLYYNGKKTAIWTKLSQGKREDLRDRILGKIRGQLRLETNPQLGAFIECPMSGRQYATYLIERKLIVVDPPAR